MATKRDSEGEGIFCPSRMYSSKFRALHPFVKLKRAVDGIEMFQKLKMPQPVLKVLVRELIKLLGPSHDTYMGLSELARRPVVLAGLPILLRKLGSVLRWQTLQEKSPADSEISFQAEQEEAGEEEEYNQRVSLPGSEQSVHSWHEDLSCDITGWTRVDGENKRFLYIEHKTAARLWGHSLREPQVREPDPAFQAVSYPANQIAAGTSTISNPVYTMCIDDTNWAVGVLEVHGTIPTDDQEWCDEGQVDDAALEEYAASWAKQTGGEPDGEVRRLQELLKMAAKEATLHSQSTLKTARSKQKRLVVGTYTLYPLHSMMNISTKDETTKKLMYPADIGRNGLLLVQAVVYMVFGDSVLGWNATDVSNKIREYDRVWEQYADDSVAAEPLLNP